MTTLKSVTTKLPQEVRELWLAHCKKNKTTSYKLLQKLIASELMVDWEKNWSLYLDQEKKNNE